MTLQTAKKENMLKDGKSHKQTEISHRINYGRVFYKHDRITIKTLFALKEVSIHWEDIDFCSLTPAVEKVNNEWKDYKGGKLNELKFLEIKIALKNRHDLFKGVNFFFKTWLILLLNLKAMFGADDKPLAQKGVITIHVKFNTLSVEREVFIDFLSQKSKFDLIVCF